MIEIVCGVILNEDGEMLLLHRNTPQLSRWEIPGGKVEAGETPAAAVVRECKEELGVDIEVVKELPETILIRDDQKYFCRRFLSTLVNDDLPMVNEADKFDQVKYFSFAQILQMSDISTNVRRFAVMAQAGKADI
jgi:8-oxo-dGTP pyrophosphatase MutT (NUDIX family)